MTVIILISVPLFIADSKIGFSTVDLLNLVLMVVGLAGTFGYAYKRKIASKSFWTTFLVVSFAYQAVFSFYLDQHYGAAPATSTSDALVTFVPLIPMFVAIYFYIHKTRLFN